MKRAALLFAISFLFAFHSTAHRAAAAENDPKRSTNLTSNNGTDASSGTENVGEQKKEAKKEVEKVERREGSGEKTVKEKGKEKPVEDRQHKGESENERSKEEAGTEKLPTVDLHADECDPANRCIDEKSKFVACLRVPGKDSLDLSLLIQNKGTGSLDIRIHAPDFVILEQKTVLLKANEDKEVKVSVKEGGNDTVIVLKGGEGTCNLNFNNIVSDTVTKTEASAQPLRTRSFSLRSCLILIVLSVALLSGLAYSFIRYRKMRSEGANPNPKYQQADLRLPLSTGGKKDAGEAADGWDNSWGDDWDDVEAPVTPSKPVLTPSLKGLASRRFNKDSWKD